MYLVVESSTDAGHPVTQLEKNGFDALPLPKSRNPVTARMKAIFRATAVLGSASILTVLIGLISAKVAAVLLGPSGFGLMALLQAVVNIVVLFAGLGVPSALVREGARAIADGEPDREAALRRSAWIICLSMGLAAALLMLLFRRPLSELALDDPARSMWIVLIAPAVVVALAIGVQNGILNARRRIGDLARINVLAAAISLGPVVLLLWLFRDEGVAPAVTATFLALWLVSYFYYRKAAADSAVSPPPLSGTAVRTAGRQLLEFGIPYMGSMIVGGGVLMLVPLLILQALGAADVGLFRAANQIAIGYLGVLLAAMAQDYFPRVSGAAGDPDELRNMINQQLRLVLLVAGPVILALLAAVPFLIPILYSREFLGAADVLEWQLIADIFKLAAWTMSFVIMARLGGRIYFLTELCAGGLLLMTSWLGMRTYGVAGVGMAFLATSAFACALGWAVLWRNMRLKWTRSNLVLFLLLAGAAALVRALPALGLDGAKTPAAALLAALFAGYSALTIWRELGGWHGLRNWRSWK